MKNFKLIKWVDVGRYMSNNNMYQYIINWTCISLLGQMYKYIYTYIYIYIYIFTIYNIYIYIHSLKSL